MSRHQERILAFQALYAWDMQDKPQNWTPEFTWTKEDDKEAHDFARLLVFACISNIETIDNKIKKHLSNWSIDRIGKVELAILRIGVYGLLYQTETDAAVTIHESVLLARDYATGDAFKFVNAILDSVSKEQ